jgi:hypothetical protein
MNSISLRILIVVAAAALGYVVPAQAENYFCQQQFALCTSAPCIPEPGNPKVAICTCDVEDGPNLATVACDTVKPSTDANGVRTVYSQFALKQFAQGKRTLKCAAATPWTWCLNKPCTPRQSYESHLCLRCAPHLDVPLNSDRTFRLTL